MRIAVVENLSRKAEDRHARDLLLQELEGPVAKARVEEIRSELGDGVVPARGRRGIRVDPMVVEQERALDGRFLLFSTDLSLDGRAMYREYFAKDAVEKAFRTSKGELSLGPVRYRRKDRLDAYATVVYVAHLLWSWAERRLQEKYPERSLSHAMRSLKNVAWVRFGVGKSVRQWATRLTTEQEKVLATVSAVQYVATYKQAANSGPERRNGGPNLLTPIRNHPRVVVNPFLREGIRAQYALLQWSDYPRFRDWIRDAVGSGLISPDDAEQLLVDFPDPRPVRPPSWEEDDGAEAKLRDPPDVGPLARLKPWGWITDERAMSLRLNAVRLRGLIGLDDEEALLDIQENALHVLGRCNNPEDWGENRRGLVYGMVQSGKTANMITLIHMAMAAGYRLFIILAGDKTSLRDQTQGRINAAFDLSNGSNLQSLVYSPTWREDYRNAGSGYLANFRYNDLARGESWSVIIVVKKHKDHLTELTSHIQLLKGHMASEGKDFGSTYPALILDDEADYASQNNDVYGTGNTIHNELVALRNAIPRNAYVGYTATPQACLSASTEDIVGYPRDFIWLLEPYMDQREDGQYAPRSYLGAWEVFWDYDRWLVHEMGRDEWPHHERDPRGRHSGIYVPDRDPTKRGQLTTEDRLYEVETAFLEEVLGRQRRPIPALSRALIDFLLGCGVRWWRYWKEAGGGELPSTELIERQYPYHAAMIHLSVKQENQERIVQIAQRQWAEVVQAKRAFDPARSPADDLFRDRLRRQQERTAGLLRRPSPPWEELSYFIDRAIEIAGRPIKDPNSPTYEPYASGQFVYLLNSSDSGMELAYAKDVDDEVRTKKAAIIVGGQILSRGLTVEGLSVSVFGRTAEMPLGDATLQMGRWFGHRMKDIDLVSIHLQRQVRQLMRELADADRYLRLQIKDSIFHGHRPDRILLELRNSPSFRATSPSKSAFLMDDGGNMAFSGKLALLDEPSFRVEDILFNRARLEHFEDSHVGSEVFSRARLYCDVNPDEAIELLSGFRCDPDASQVSFSKYATYLRDWRDRARQDLPRLPRINIAVMKRWPMDRQRLTTIARPCTVEEARESVTGRFGSIVGGAAHAGEAAYRGDAFLDKGPEWHRSPGDVPRERASGDDILIVFYGLHPNYIAKRLWDSSLSDGNHPEGDWKPTPRIELQRGDLGYVDPGGRPVEDLAVLTFAAWTPGGGPRYAVKVNRLIPVTEVLQHGRQQSTDEIAQ